MSTYTKQGFSRGSGALIWRHLQNVTVLFILFSSPKYSSPPNLLPAVLLSHEHCFGASLQSLLWAASCRNYFLRLPTVSLRRRKRASTRGQKGLSDTAGGRVDPTWSGSQDGHGIILSNQGIIFGKEESLLLWAPRAKCHLVPLYPRVGQCFQNSPACTKQSRCVNLFWI